MLVSIACVIVGLLSTKAAVNGGHSKLAFMSGMSTIAAFAATL